MKKLILFLPFILVHLVYAQNHDTQENQVIVTEVINGANVYGEKWSSSAHNSTDIATALAKHEELVGKEMIFTGNITKVCQNTGCWMILETNGKFARVDFNSHSFFIPKDTQGTAEVFGVLHSKTMSDEKRKHLEDEGTGKLPEQVFEITATSIKIRP
ncbi:hypothetical protein MNBD_GAMMA01-1971 [hydrothermal vent metagenome]|uniref:DUF4920 domain-containing protein n=1 Tax=hydrothermal vent metagenome TaxID=652676 RepID=A0A3B0W3V0_9ZZZZ